MKRSALEVKIDILRAIGKGIRKPTRIVFKANIDWTVLQRHLVKAGLIINQVILTENGKVKNRYHLTEKGREFLRRYRHLMSLVPGCEALPL